MIQDSKRLKLLLKDCTKGFYQQMYFWGKDVMHPSGNQLQAYGFKKTPSKGLRGTSCYTHESSRGTIQLYGSCAGFYTDQINLVFLRSRCRFYQWLPDEKLVAGCWQQSDLKALDPSEMLTHLTPFLEWWEHYEQWIEEHFGEQFREKCYAEWTKVNKDYTWLSPQLARKWVKQFLVVKEKHMRPKHFA